jgi:hypothetical protein
MTYMYYARSYYVHDSTLYCFGPNTSYRRGSRIIEFDREIFKIFEKIFEIDRGFYVKPPGVHLLFPQILDPPLHRGLHELTDSGVDVSVGGLVV